jgi:hypothetical protein
VATSLVMAAFLLGDAIWSGSQAQFDWGEAFAETSVEILDAAFKCPTENRTDSVDSPFFPGKKIASVSHWVNKFSGSIRQFDLTQDITETVDLNDKSEKNTILRRYTAKWADLQSVADIRTDKLVVFECRDGKRCFTHVRDTVSTQAIRMDGVMLHPSPVTDSYTTIYAGIYVCDGATATNIKNAAEILIRFNGGTLGEFYRIQKDVSGGLLT